ncbi:dynamin family protein [Thiobacter aerophilum]|uniref:Dynamin family protein n=1 Tax=Thiobacter aerophilum TaxID=3121275 RepID=A0ABV0EGU6_9BURK
MNTLVERQIAHYQRWREDILAAIDAYQAWLEARGEVDAEQSLRLYDLIESLRHDHITLAFVAEFSRGKTELINALFFADFKQRLLPSDAGRTTMCPTEIFYDPSEPPYLRLLPIETRYREETIRQLKKKPVEWVQSRLDLDSPQQMVEVLQTLTETKRVSQVEARTMGLWDDQDPMQADMLRDSGWVEIPKWRHALINYPHPLLKSGLAILDTPGLNALGSEPELTLSMIPGAHAVLFLLATDTGVTRSDMEIWQKHVQPHAAHSIVILNKVDTLWDELKSWEKVQASIERQRQATALQLGVSPANVLALSAQKALLAKIRGDEALLLQSGIGALETMLAREVIPLRQEILRKAVTREIGALVLASYKSVYQQLCAVRHEQKELASLSGKNKEVIQKMLNRLHEDKLTYEETIRAFNVTRTVITQQGRILLNNLSLERLDGILQKAHDSIKGSWTTAGLTRGMQSLIRHTAQQFQHIHKHGRQIKGLVDSAYVRFHVQHGLERREAPVLDLDAYQAAFQELGRRTEAFCRDPINILTEKHFLVRRFFLNIAAEARALFERARQESEAWLRNALGPLTSQITDYKIAIERRIENIRKIHDNIDNLQERLEELAAMETRLARDVALLGGILRRLQPPAASNIQRQRDAA